MKWRNAIPLAKRLAKLAKTNPELFWQEWEQHHETLEAAAVKLASAIRLRLMLHRRFVLARLALELLPTPSWEIDTTSVNALAYWRFNPIWFLTRVGTDEQMGEFIAAHEVLHWALRHCWPTRALGKNENVWNLAIDHVVNLLLRRLGLRVPPEAILFQRWAHEKLSAEEVYRRLCRELGGHTGISLEPGSPTWDDATAREAGRVLIGEDRALRPFDEHEDWKKAEPTSKDLARLSAAAKAAADFARRIGKAPGMWIEVFGELLEKEALDWGTLLYLYAQEALESEPYPVRWPNQRYAQQGILVPDTRDEPTPLVVVGVDTSGSISREDFGRFLGHLTPLLAATGAETQVVLFDAAIQWEGVYDPHLDTPKGFATRIPFKGRGGTNFTPVFEWVQANYFDRLPDLVVMLTDGYGDNFASPPTYPVLWVLTPDGRETQAFGDVIKMQ